LPSTLSRAVVVVNIDCFFLTPQLLSQPFRRNEKVDQPDFKAGIGIPRNEIVGFRAPYLESNENLFKTLHDSKYIAYDASLLYGLGDLPWPHTLEEGTRSWPKLLGKLPGLWELPVHQIFIPPDDLSSQYGFKPGFLDRTRQSGEVAEKDGAFGITAMDWTMWYVAKTLFPLVAGCRIHVAA
jgi:hypothetical protein